MNIIEILLTIIQLLFIIRFHLELSKVNGFIEPVNTIRRLTNPLVLPIKKIIPWYQAKKLAAILVVLLISIVVIFLSSPFMLSDSVIVGLFFLIKTWLLFLQYGMFLFVIGSWIQIPALQRINYLLYHLFEPMLRPIQKIIPPVGGLDFSPIVFLLLLSFIISNLSNLFFSG
ncbi:MAG: hypothetical protein CR975_03000 [Gammaproteobacteria bacterium]|nr:MAG: hypothetical protein CR975_03000 [Gammaproteobacteria bacterium]